ncbi:MAG: phosphoadenosine phosphosulfate reductase family protein [Crenarchaeota archaeon]|nr:phosphoadenosine phosphosulfate reductase family protein [Thermoproteota archaeon]
MVEAIPLLADSGQPGYVATSIDMTLMKRPLEKARLYLWMGNDAIDITETCIENNFIIRINDNVLDIDKWFEPVVIDFYRTIDDIEEIVEIILRTCRQHIEGSRILLSYSGGKDSTATLITLLKLSEVISFKLHTCYTYIPYLDNTKNLKFIDEVSRKLSINIDIASPPRRIVLRYLRKYGLPYRRCRWCTYLKVRPLRELSKKIEASLYAVGDRATECEKRWRRLHDYIFRLKFISKREFRPIYTLSLIDVLNICKRYSLVNPQYMRGLQRVSCVLCPYKSLPELNIEGIDETEDPGLIESILRRSFYRWYINHVDYSSYLRYSLWRFVPKVARLFYKFRNHLTKNSELVSMKLEDYARTVSDIWRIEESKSNFPRIRFEELMNHVKKHRVSELLLSG